MLPFDTALLIGAAVVIVAVVAVRFGARIGLPSLLLFLGLGLVLGDSGLGIQFSDAQVAHDLGLFALAVILAEGGLTTKWSDIRSAVVPALLLATLGVAISIVVVATFAHVVLGFDPVLAVLIGAVLSPTDAAAVFSVLRGMPIPHRLRGMLEAESGLNDAPTILLVAAMSAIAAGQGGGSPLELVLVIVVELAGGAVLGVLAGWLGAMLLRRLALPNSGLYPIAVFTWVLLVYSGGVALHVSGFAAAYLAALILGNAGLPHRVTTRSFVEGIGWMAQIGLFVMLGLLASPGRVSPADALLGVAVGLVLTLVARPLAVWVCLWRYRLGWRANAFLSWAGLRGAVPIVLTTIPLADGVAGAEQVFDLVLVFVVAFTVLQAPTLPWAARVLKLVDPARAADVEVEIAALDRVGAELMQVRIPPGNQLAGLFINELRLPPDVSVSLIVRGDLTFTPGPSERVRVGDELLIVTPSDRREATVARVRALGRRGRLARWRGEAGLDEG